VKGVKEFKEGQSGEDIDQWILANEQWLRHRLSSDPLGDWTTGLVKLGGLKDSSNPFKPFTDSTLTEEYRKIQRPAKMDGFTCLDAKRSPFIYIQPDMDRYRSKFETMTGGQLNGLDWSNIFVAGGITLGSLLCVESKSRHTEAVPTPIHIPSMWDKSDVDIYIYDLNPIEANRKIEHIFEVFKQNLPPDARESIMVVRNSKTITFMTTYPYRRFQIVLKLVKSPAEVLLNFDLDICAMGFDGKELYMLPRAARALQSELRFIDKSP
jgi:hypothetical protein